jgi:hypothetical protein
MFMKCSWICVNTHGNAIVKQDKYGFLVFTHMEPYVFPSMVSHVSPCYYCKNLLNHEQ